MTRPFAGLNISTFILLGEGRQHHSRNPFRRIIGVKGSPRIGGAHQPVVVLGGQQHELALAAPRDLDRPSESSLDDLAGSVAQVGQRKMRHRNLLKKVYLSIFMILAILAMPEASVKSERSVSLHLMGTGAMYH
jgi:hypothetical protein